MTRMKRKKVCVQILLSIIICNLLFATGCAKSDAKKNSAESSEEDSTVVSEEANENKYEIDGKNFEEANESVVGYLDESGNEYWDESDTDGSNNGYINESQVTTAGNQAKNYYTAEDYLANSSLFVPVWKNTWNPPAKLLDFEEKWQSFFEPKGRLMSVAHRGDNNIYYPEDSIEGIMSCILAGVDMLELDIRMTRDGVPVLMHDATVTRTTNVSELRAKGRAGIPSSDNISDWTLEQLRELRLLHGTKVTNYVIPTLNDVIMVCANRIFIFLDIKEGVDWDSDIYPIVQRYKAYRSVWLPHTYSYSVSEARLIQLLSTIERDSGYRIAFQCSVSPSNVGNVVQLISRNNLPMQLRAGDYAPSFDSAFAPYFGEYRIHVNALYAPYNTLASWKTMHAKGYNFIHVDDYMTLVKYIADTHF